MGRFMRAFVCMCFKFGWQKTRIWIMSIIRCLLTMNRENHFEWWKMGPTEIRWIKCLFWAMALSRVCTTVSLVSSRQLPTRTKGLAGQTAVIMIFVFLSNYTCNRALSMPSMNVSNHRQRSTYFMFQLKRYFFPLLPRRSLLLAVP